VPNATTLVEPLIKQGAPIKYVIPSDPPTGSDLRANITSNARHPNAARLFLDYRTSQEAQEVVCKAALNAVASPRTDAASCIKLSPEFKFIDYFALTPDVESQILDALGLPPR
jgi:ABC-type Fe3+ transport system substrate-binding protein